MIHGVMLWPLSYSGRVPHQERSQSVEFIESQARLPDDLGECALGNISWMIGYHDASVGLGMVPDLVTPLCLTIKHKACLTKFPDHLGNP